MMRIVGVLSSLGPVRTGYSHGFSYSVSGRPVTVVVRTLIEYDECGWHYRGLRLLITTQGESVYEAAAAIESAAETALGMMACAAAAETGPYKFHLIYEDVDPGQSGEMVIYSRQHHSDVKLRKAMWDHLEPLYLGLARADESTSGRVDRALRWYRAGVLEGDPIDRFAAFWLALESLNVLLERKWGLQSDERLCPACGASLGKRQGLLGVERLLTEIPEGGEANERRVRKLRNKLMHATEDLRANAAEAAELAEIVAVAISRGVAKVFGWSENRESRFARPPLPSPPPFGAQATFRFTRTDNRPLGVEGFHPFGTLRTEEHVTHDERGEPNRVEYSGRVSLTMSEGVEVHHDTIAVLVTNRMGVPIQAKALESERTTDPPRVPAQRGKGVTLWELGEGDVWFPDTSKEL